MIRLSVPSIADEECAAVERVLRSGQLVHGEECELFERELAEYIGCKEVVVVSSGTAALHLALLSLGVGPGDAVLVPDFTFPATVNVVELVGARPIFVDVDLFTYNIAPDNIRRAIAEWHGPETIRAIMPVHEFGCPVDITAIMQIAKEYDLLVVEDAACGLGAIQNGQKVGAFGRVGCFSFHPRKAITTGEGGAIATNDTELSAKLRVWRNHGIQRTEKGLDFILPGFNYRMTNIQAALGRVQLLKFDNWLTERKKIQKIYRNILISDKVQLPEEVNGHAWQTFMIRLADSCDRDRIISILRERGIETNIGAHALHMLSYYARKYSVDCEKAIGNNSERLYKFGLALPLYQGLDIKMVDFVSRNTLDILSLQ
ncbi:UDP-4-amino-4-deoxy-L-arabinose--oxoglutarate aminotransferase [Desulfosporosinus sp. I2]|uniref:DegT/DnrJ/EryC1/StrS family aminotransferase n=1 Tax=Desulfosporosinus sp. I2 TaxID=1617025 RepID=UPI0005EDA1A0|nr:DegT/DnrJ/EryC1/StrS family aminotransferase [Desulfosporosinus sp. I2]KJR47797.1 UDP-4-amino-4-deoxy-L-arabinose--oxoglutarate aminotransferase [Desulfosporosinus sp. I2]